jgi:CelD/BcsL family acetyltransferase involved in cellulose biosynthesis
LKRGWLNARGLVSRAFADTRIDAFFADASRGAGRPCGLSVSRLASCGEGADVSISMTCKGRRALHILAYSLKFERFGVGNHHLEVSLRRAFTDGVQVYDFLAPRHTYKLEWSEGVMPVEDHVKALGVAGRVYADVYVARVREAGKAALKALPRSLTRMIAGAHRSTHSLG